MNLYPSAHISCVSSPGYYQCFWARGEGGPDLQQPTDTLGLLGMFRVVRTTSWAMCIKRTSVIWFDAKPWRTDQLPSGIGWNTYMNIGSISMSQILIHLLQFASFAQLICFQDALKAMDGHISVPFPRGRNQQKKGAKVREMRCQCTIVNNGCRWIQIARYCKDRKVCLSCTRQCLARLHSFAMLVIPSWLATFWSLNGKELLSKMVLLVKMEAVKSNVDLLSFFRPLSNYEGDEGNSDYVDTDYEILWS